MAESSNASASSPNADTTTTTTTTVNKRRVVVVGAGFAGLACARMLLRDAAEHLDVHLIEATGLIGGRCRQTSSFVPWKIMELGAEFVHGSESLLFRLIEQHNWPMLKIFTWAQGDGPTPRVPVAGGMSGYYIGREKRFLRYDAPEAQIRHANKIASTMEKLPPGDTREKRGLTMRDYLVMKGVSPVGISLLDAGYANTVCSTVDDLGIEETARLERVWGEDGGDDFRMLNSFRDLLDYLASGIPKKSLNWPVKRIEYPPNAPIKLTSTIGEVIECDHVIVTASLACLQQDVIKFSPALPAPKRAAIDNLNMFGAMKICVKFSRQFWPTSLHGMIITDCFLPEIFFDQPERAGFLTDTSTKDNFIDLSQNADGTFVILGFACATVYDRLTKMTPDQIRDEMLKMCDEIFGNQDVNRMCVDPRKKNLRELPVLMNPATPASDSYLDILIMDWGKEPYVRGGYSSPSIWESDTHDRRMVAAPIENRVHFAGEHTMWEHYMSVHAALESGIRAANEVFHSEGLDHLILPGDFRDDEWKDTVAQAKL